MANAKPPVKAAAGPAWRELSSAQQTALQPLASGWTTISEAQKRKWIALSANYSGMHPDDQARLHARMTEWVGLSPEQRSQARLNFAQTKALPPEEKKAKWEAYQALSPDEKSKLASRAAPRPTGAAVAVKPVAPQKLAAVPVAKRDIRHPAKIAAGPAAADTGAAAPAPAPVPAPTTPAPQ